MTQATSDVITDPSGSFATFSACRRLGRPPHQSPVTAPDRGPVSNPNWAVEPEHRCSRFQPDIVQNQQLQVRAGRAFLARTGPQPASAAVLSLNALYQLNGLGASTWTSAEAVMTGEDDQGDRPVDFDQQQRAAGLEPRFRETIRDFVTVAGRPDQLQHAAWHPRAPLANVRQSQYALLRQRAFLAAGRPPARLTRLTRFFPRSRQRTTSQFKHGFSRLRARRRWQRLEAQRAFYEDRPDHDRPIS